MRIRKLAAMCMLLMTGCTTIKPVGLDFSQLTPAVRRDNLDVVVMEDAPIQFYTPGMVAGAGLIDDMTRPDGSSIQLPSSSYLMALALREQLISKHGLKVGDVPNELTKVNLEKNQGAPGRPTLEVYVDLRFLSYRPTAWQTYQYMLISHARILDGSGDILWQNKCHIGRAADKSLQLDRVEFKNNDAKRLKDIMSLAVRRCVGDMMKPTTGGF